MNYLGGAFLKRGVLILMVLHAMVSSAFAQNGGERNTMPPFNILLTTSKYLKAAELKKNVPSMLIYFDPDCDHCRVFTADLLKNAAALKNVQVVMISYTSPETISKFAADYKISRFPNIRVGTEGSTYIVRYFYNIQKFPFIAVFNKKGALTASYRDAPPVKELISQTKK